MFDNDKCPIWGTSAKIWRSSGMGGRCVDSKRAGGVYDISHHATMKLTGEDDKFRARLTTWIVDQHKAGIEAPRITTNVLESVNLVPALRVHERANRLLDYFESVQRHIGDKIDVEFSSLADGLSDVACSYAAVSESLNEHEIAFLIDQLVSNGYINKSGGKCQITFAGYTHIEEANRRSTISKNAFVAMWFGESMQQVYEDAIDPGIRQAGYIPIRIDGKEHNNKIDDEIVAEIQRAKFVVADFTHGKGGMRGGVYYEAGFARGLGLEVISTCEVSLLKENKIHFDTRQFNHIGWSMNDLEGFRNALSNRISATIGDGPLRNS
jgi:nucleoside 2-deoxyribosyltransferase